MTGLTRFGLQRGAMGLFGSKRSASTSSSPTPAGVRLKAEWTQGHPPQLRTFLVALQGRYEAVLTAGAVKTEVTADFWGAVLEAGAYHHGSLPAAANLSDTPRALLGRLDYQRNILAALTEFASYWGVPGALVQACLDAEELNKHTAALHASAEDQFDWQRTVPAAFACSLIPRDRSGRGATGLLGTHQGRFTFDTDTVSARSVFTAMDVEFATQHEDGGDVLWFHTNGKMGRWERAECFSPRLISNLVLEGAGVELRE
ncbi:hypothetical protein ABH931_000137 [Streptacidiphilus sp. MAP12-33]|uniref:hypothetical protein n=1 Tax=Streptacidiphilus sp. MAP12-33 TaxID=3156266 RepID=UPI00351193F3